MKISIKNWKKDGISWLSNLAYAGLGLVASLQAAEMLGYKLDFLSEGQKKATVVAVIMFKFIEKMTAKKDTPPPTDQP